MDELRQEELDQRNDSAETTASMMKTELIPTGTIFQGQMVTNLLKQSGSNQLAEKPTASLEEIGGQEVTPRLQ